MRKKAQIVFSLKSKNSNPQFAELLLKRDGSVIEVNKQQARSN